MDMSHYRELFFSETREHINNLNDLVVSLEEATDQRETVDALFREAHSIKGMAATMGFDGTARLAHHLEDLMDGFRSSGKVPTPAIDYLLEGIDLLESLLEDLQKDVPERDLTAFLNRSPEPESDLSPSEPDETTEPVTAMTAAATPPAAHADAVPEPPEPAPRKPETFQVQVRLKEDTPASAARCLLILRELEKIGTLQASRPDMATLRQGDPCLQIAAWLCTTQSPDQIKTALMTISSVSAVDFAGDRRAEQRPQQETDARTIRMRTELLDQFVNLAGELITQRNILASASRGKDWEGLNRALGQADRLIGDLHHHVLQARLMPLTSITGRLPRIVRDLSRQSGKQVTLKMTGTEVGIDRMILEELSDPLMHLVRNAVDHGIESAGAINLSARRERNTVVIEIKDDGRGMDPRMLRKKAIDRGVITPNQADEMSDPDALMLICQPGFSTASQVTEISGRGVGMDVVKAAVNRLGGTLEILSAPGSGTTFQMQLPLSIAIIRILLVQCGGHPCAIPLARVHRTLDLPSEDVQSWGRERFFSHDDDVIDLFSLSEVLDLPSAPPGDTTWTLTTEFHGRLIGLQVDGFLGQREAYIKPLGFPLNHLAGLSGAVIEADGDVVFLVDPQPLLEQRQFVRRL